MANLHAAKMCDCQIFPIRLRSAFEHTGIPPKWRLVTRMLGLGLAGTEGPGRNRERGLGAPDATAAAPRLPCRQSGARTRPCARPATDRAHRAPIRRHCRARIGLSPGAKPDRAPPARMVASGAAESHRRTGHNLQLRLQTRKEDTLRFL